MDKILKKELSLSKRAKIGIASGLTLVLVLSVIFCFHVYIDTHSIVQRQAVQSITNISQLNEESITKSIENRQMLLQTIAARMEQGNEKDLDAVLSEMAYFKDAYNFANMGIVDEDHVLHMLDGTEKDLKGTEFEEFVWDGNPHVTESYAPYDGSEYMVNAFSYPVYEDGKVKCVLMATYHSINLTERMNLSSMEGKGYNFLLDSEGRVVIYPRNYENEEYTALMKHINDVPEIIPDESGDKYFEYKGEQYYAHFEKLGVNNWFLMTCAKKADVFAEAHTIMHMIYLAVGIVWIIILLSVWGTFCSMRRNKTKRLRATYYDEMLNIGNANAMSVCYKYIPEESKDKMYLVVFDVDKFKEFNYIYGSKTGDELLKYIAKVVQEAFPRAYLFRYVSDYFVAFHPKESRHAFAKKMQHLDDKVDRDVKNGVIQPFEVSAGVKELQAGESISTAFSDAMIARETIKGNYLRHFAFYDGEVRKQRLIHMELEKNFTEAVEKKEFHIYYQPKYDIRNGKIIGAEALTRWVKEDGTIISPGMFIPCFEKSYQIILLDEIVLTEVCRQMKEMEEEGLDIKPVSVNLSRLNLRNPEILPKIESIIKKAGIDPSNLAFEITESALTEENIPMKSIMDFLHGLGCRVDMDDYGVGASSPDALISNNFDTLKIDKSFVDRIGDERVEDFIRSTAHLAMRWGVDVLAEGVEEKQQAERLLELGCTYVQGFYYSKPVTESAYRALLREEAALGAKGGKLPLTARTFSEDVCAVLDGNSLPTYIIDPENYVVMYCNEALQKYLGENPTGGLCYQKVRRREKPCEGCSAMRLYRQGIREPKEVDTHLGLWILLYTSPLHWRGREYIQLTCVDITKQKKVEAELLEKVEASGKARLES